MFEYPAMLISYKPEWSDYARGCYMGGCDEIYACCIVHNDEDVLYSIRYVESEKSYEDQEHFSHNLMSINCIPASENILDYAMEKDSLPKQLQSQLDEIREQQAEEKRQQYEAKIKREEQAQAKRQENFERQTYERLQEKFGNSNKESK